MNFSDWRHIPISSVTFSQGTGLVLSMTEFSTMGDLANASDIELLRLANFGRNRLGEVRAVISALRLTEAVKAEAISELPPLNPTSKAPRDGSAVRLMLHNGEEYGAWWSVSSQEWKISHRNGGSAWAASDGSVLGWWPLPKVLD